MLIVVVLSFLIQGLVLSEYKQSNGSKVDMKQEKPINVKKFKNGEKRFYKDFDEYIFYNSQTKVIEEKVKDRLIKILDDKNNILKTFKKYYKKEEIVEPDEAVIKEFGEWCKNKKVFIDRIGGAHVYKGGIIYEGETIFKHFEYKEGRTGEPFEILKWFTLYDIQGNKLWGKQYGTREGADIKGVSEDGKIIIVSECRPATIVPEGYFGPPYSNEYIIIYDRSGKEIIRTKEGNYDFEVKISPNGKFVASKLNREMTIEVEKSTIIGIDVEKRKIVEYELENREWRKGVSGIRRVDNNGDVIIIRTTGKEEKINIKKLEK